LLVASDRVHADLFTRQPDGRWLLTEGRNDWTTRSSFNRWAARIQLAADYDNVDFPAVTSPLDWLTTAPAD
jgi:hypothetical protein